MTRGHGVEASGSEAMLKRKSSPERSPVTAFHRTMRSMDSLANSAPNPWAGQSAKSCLGSFAASSLHDLQGLGVPSHHLESEMKSPHLVDFS